MEIYKNEVLIEENKRPIVYDLFYNRSTERLPLVIFCHGYKGFKDWGAWNLVAKRFADAGFCFLKFNFSHNGGTVEDPIDFPDLEAFAQNNFSLELEDLHRILKGIHEKSLPNLPTVHKIHLIAHSRGGGIVLIKAKEDSRINKVVTWASVSDFKSRFQEDTPQFRKWQETGVTYVENTRTKQQLPHYFQFYEDYKANEQRFNIEEAVKNIKNPLLIIHGSDDPTVPVSEARRLKSWTQHGTLQIIEGADHVFGTQHPWKEAKMPEHLKKVVNKTIDFLKGS